MKNKFFFFIFLGYSISLFSQNGVIPVKEDGKWGLYDIESSILRTEPRFDLIGSFQQSGIQVIENDKMGLASPNGALLVEPAFKEINALPLAPGMIEYFIVRDMENQLNLYSRSQKKTILPKKDYQKISIVKSDLFSVTFDDKSGIVNQYGTYIIPPQEKSFYKSIQSKEYLLFSDASKKFGLMKLDNTIAVPAKYDNLQPIHESYSIFLDDSNDLTGLIQHKNNVVSLKPIYQKIKHISEHAFLLTDQSNKAFLYNDDSKEMITLPYGVDKLDPFIPGYYKVKSGDYTGIINEQGEIVIKILYSKIYVQNKSKLHIQLAKDGKVGIYDLKNHKELLPPIFSKIEITDEKHLKVFSEKGQGLYSENYKEIIPSEYYEIKVAGNSVNARKERSMDIFWLDNDGNIKEQESYKEYYTLKVGHKRNAFIAVSSPNVPVKKPRVIKFPNVNYEWVESDSSHIDYFAYRKKDGTTIECPYEYKLLDNFDTHFNAARHLTKKARRSELIEKLCYTSRSVKVYRLFDGNKGEFLFDETDFVGFRFTDMTKNGIPRMAALKMDGSFSMINLDGTFAKDHNGEIFNASYLERLIDGRMRYAIGGTWEVNRDSLKNLKVKDYFYINSLKIFDLFGLEKSYNRNKWHRNAYLKNAKWGYLDEDGKVIIPAIYDNASVFRNGKAVVEKDGKLGCIDARENIILPFEYSNISILKNGQIEIEKSNDENISFLINKKGQQILMDDYSFVGKLKDGIRRVRKNGKYGLVNEVGEVVLNFEYDSLGKFNEGFAVTKQDEQIFIIDEKGNPYLKNKNYEIKGTVFDGLVRIKENDKYGFVDINGSLVITPKFKLAFDFDAGLSRVVAAKKTGLIDKQGNIVMQPKDYSLVFKFNEYGLAKVQHEQYGPKGLINRNGQEIVKPFYDEIEPFSNGFAIVEKGGFFGLINVAGELVIPLKLYGAYKVDENGILAIKDKFQGYWKFHDTENNVVNNLKFTKPAFYKDGHAIVTMVTDTLSYHKCLVNIEGDTLFFSSKNEQIYFYKDGIIGVRVSTLNERTLQTTHAHFFKRIEEDKYRNGKNGYRSLTAFQDGVAIVQSKITKGLMDQNANPITQQKYKEIKRNPDGSYTAIPFKLYGLVDKNGEFILEPIYDYMSTKINNRIIQDNIYLVEKGDQLGYIRNDGVWVWELRR